MKPSIEERARKIKMFLLDVDGVMTDGSLFYTREGEEIKVFNVKDGMGIKLLRKAGIEVGVISARNSHPLHIRLKDLGIERAYTGNERKVEALEDIVKENSLKYEEIAYMGDDYVDIPVMKRVGFPIAVADAVEEVKNIAVYTTKSEGGKGAVREAVEFILKLRGDFEDLIKEFIR